MPYLPSSSAYAFVSPERPAFIAAYAGEPSPPRKENSEQILMIRPLLCGIIYFATAWLRSKAPVRLIAIIGSHSALPKSRTSAILQIPAQLTRISILPKVSTHLSATLSQIPSSVISPSINAYLTPHASISFCVVPSSSTAANTKIFAPAFASARAKACPSPLTPPVTIAFLPFSEKKSILKSLIFFMSNSSFLSVLIIY